jgi:ethanolamine utilization protein EutN
MGTANLRVVLHGRARAVPPEKLPLWQGRAAIVDRRTPGPYSAGVHFARVLGPLVATAKIRPLEGYRLLWIEPTDARGRPSGEPLVAVDTGQYSHGEWVYFVTSREASLPLRDSFCAVDAAIVGKVDCVDLEGGVSTFGCDPAPAAPPAAAPAPAAADATGTP